MRPNRLAGHGLRHEGRYWTGFRYVSGGMAPGVCECGAESKPLPSAAQRQRWHRDHKNDIRSEIGLARPAADHQARLAAEGTETT